MISSSGELRFLSEPTLSDTEPELTQKKWVRYLSKNVFVLVFQLKYLLFMHLNPILYSILKESFHFSSDQRKRRRWRRQESSHTLHVRHPYRKRMPPSQPTAVEETERQEGRFQRGRRGGAIVPLCPMRRLLFISTQQIWTHHTPIRPEWIFNHQARFG